jgi:hypothetical protein
VRAIAAALVVVAACSTDGPAPEFPADYASSYAEVRDCRTSADHDLHKIRILADPAAMASYVSRGAPFPDGAIVLKEEYDFADPTCAGPIVQWTVMRRIDADWRWQRVDLGRAVISEDEPRCIGCHAQCGQPPDGFDGTCAVP